MSLQSQKILVANRGEIALRVLRTAKRLGLRTISIYTKVDALSPHVVLADEAILLCPDEENMSLNAKGYRDAEAIVKICVQHNVTLVHPGYGFLAENADLAEMLEGKGVTLLGPTSQAIREMGLKHQARALARRAGVPVVPGSESLVHDVEHAIEVAEQIGFPVMLKATAGGGGMGLITCGNADELRKKFDTAQARAQTLFNHDGLFIERFIPSSRHIEVQVFGNGNGHVVHMGERECSIQRRHQKVIEEAPSPFLRIFPDLRDSICAAAVDLCKLIRYKSTGTIEFLVDEVSKEFYFLEMNTRLQVEHGITEALHPGLDIVELMILQGIAERTMVEGATPLDSKQKGGLDEALLEQDKYSHPTSLDARHAIEARVYCEDPSNDFKPCPGLLQSVDFPEIDGSNPQWLRIDSWIATGTTISPFYDPLACKLIVSAPSRAEAISRLKLTLNETKILGPPNNVAYLKAICSSDAFRAGAASTTFLNAFPFVPHAIDVLSGGIETTIQDYPGRLTGYGIPKSGPMDSLAFRAANILVDNPLGMEALEIVIPSGSYPKVKLLFHVQAVIALTGAEAEIKVNGETLSNWMKIVVPAGAKVEIAGVKDGRGMRAYLAIRGGFPGVPEYLESKSTSMGLGGYQGRPLAAGDQLALAQKCGVEPDEISASLPLLSPLIPLYPQSNTPWVLHALSGPHDDTEFLTQAGIDAFYDQTWRVSASSNRMGIRLEPTQPDFPGLEWARKNGGEGGSHPSNIHDNGYAMGSVNLNGDTPVLLTNEGPSMGGYVCVSTVATADQWKFGQLRPGCTVRFERISFDEAMALDKYIAEWIDTVLAVASGFSASLFSPLDYVPQEKLAKDPKLLVIPADDDQEEGAPQVVFRQAGDSAILIEYGPLKLDFGLRARIHALETEARKLDISGVMSFAPCIRSTMCHYDPHIISQSDLLASLVTVERSLPSSALDMEFPARKLTFPIVLDDRWNRSALDRYMKSIRDRAVYLPSNIEYLARNNGLDSAEEALERLISSTWLVFGVGFYLACPFLVPVDPRCRLVGQKMNPSRTYTPRGAIGIAGLVAAIYPVESPGGYQLYGRTLPTWQTWAQGPDFDPAQPWILQSFDQVVFESVTEEEYTKLEQQFDSGQYKFKIEDVTFSMREHMQFLKSIQQEIDGFRAKQFESVAMEEMREAKLLKEWRKNQDIHHREDANNYGNILDTTAGDHAIAASLSGIVWKIMAKPGDVIHEPGQTVVILEAMKTEVHVEAGEESVGFMVRGFGPNIVEGAAVAAGDALVLLDATR